jgi:hypothetical protein
MLVTNLFGIVCTAQCETDTGLLLSKHTTVLLVPESEMYENQHNEVQRVDCPLVHFSVCAVKWSIIMIFFVMKLISFGVALLEPMAECHVLENQWVIWFIVNSVSG